MKNQRKPKLFFSFSFGISVRKGIFFKLDRGWRQIYLVWRNSRPLSTWSHTVHSTGQVPRLSEASDFFGKSKRAWGSTSENVAATETGLSKNSVAKPICKLKLVISVKSFSSGTFLSFVSKALIQNHSVRRGNEISWFHQKPTPTNASLDATRDPRIFAKEPS